MLFRDFVYAARTLRRSPVFAATAMITIGLGIGASTAIFSVTNAVLLRPLPYKDPGRLVFAISDMTKRNVKDFPLSNASFIDLQKGTAGVFEELGAVRTFRFTVPREDKTPEQIRGAGVTTNFFRLLGARVLYGRDFEDADGVPQAAPPPNAGGGAPAPQGPPAAVILSYEYWQRRFGGSTEIFGKPMPGARQGANQVVGVLQPGFELFFPPDANMERLPDIWFALRLNYDNANRNNVSLRAIGRLKPGVSMQTAQSAASAVAADARRNYIISGTAGYEIRLEPLHKHVVAQVRPALVALMGAVVFLLLIACANVANLLLVRASLRERELAVRTALGGAWWRIVTQTMAEALLVAVGGAALGLLLANAGVSELRALAPANLPRLDAIAIDPSVLAFTALATLSATLLFGMAPALRAARPDLAHVLRAAGRTGALGAAGLLRSAVVVSEVALSFVLLIGCGLMARSFVALQRIDPGFDPQNVLTFEVLGGGGPQPQQRAAQIRDIQARLQSISGVQSVTASLPFPLAGGFTPIRWGLEPALSDPSKFQAVDWQIVIPGYFEAMHTPLLAGRTFTDADNAPDRKVAIIDQALAAKAFPNQNAVGKRILTRLVTPEPEWVEVIGVVGHVRQSSLAEPGREQIYLTDGYLSHGAVNRWALRTSGDPARFGATVRAEMAKIGGRVVLNEMQPMEALMTKARAATRFTLLLIGVFAVIAATLAAVGLYGVLSTVVRQRTAEIGVRMALGAPPNEIFRMIVGHALRLSMAGVVGGLVAAFALTRLMAGMLVGTQPTDPPTYLAMAVLFLIIAGMASWLPARRAAALDPTEALREE